jgi:hypothetical protein
MIALVFEIYFFADVAPVASERLKAEGYEDRSTEAPEEIIRQYLSN